MILVRKVYFPPLIDRINCHLLTYCLQVVFSQDGVFVHTAVLTATQGANIIPGIVTIIEKVGENSLSRSPYYYGTLIYFMETDISKKLKYFPLPDVDVSSIKLSCNLLQYQS